MYLSIELSGSWCAHYVHSATDECVLSTSPSSVATFAGVRVRCSVREGPPTASAVVMSPLLRFFRIAEVNTSTNVLDW